MTNGKLIFNYIYAIAILSLSNCSLKKDDRDAFIFKEVKWEIKVPKNFTIETLHDTTGDLKVAETLQKNSELNLIPVPAINFIKVKTNENNFLTSTVQPLDIKNKFNWEESLNYQYLVALRSLKSADPSSQIDTSTNIVKIDGLNFKRFHTHIRYQTGMDMNMYLFAKSYIGYDFSIIIVYTDSLTGIKLFDIINTSKFR